MVGNLSFIHLIKCFQSFCTQGSCHAVRVTEGLSLQILLSYDSILENRTINSNLQNREFSMKRTLSIILLIVSCLVLIVSIVFCVYSIVDINRILNKLANDPSASGIDYFGVGWEYGICLFTASFLCLILSGISKKLLQQKF